MQSQLSGQFPFGSDPQSQPADPSQSNQIGVPNAQQGSQPFLGGTFQSNLMPVPLDKPRFDSLFKNFCAKSNLKPDPRLLNLGIGTVELHRLHVEVMKEGGFAKVEQNDVWNIIGARLGFALFPSTDVEPEKSGQGVAQALIHIYKEYLQHFDAWYIAQSIENQKKMQAANANMVAHMTAFRWGPQQMQHVVQLSHMSVPDLHARGIDEKTISFVETHRLSLQRALQEQKAFQSMMRLNPSDVEVNQLPDQNGGLVAHPGMGTFPGDNNPASQINSAAANIVRQQLLQQQHIIQQQQQQQSHLLANGQNAAQDPRVSAQQSQNATLVGADMIISKIKNEFMSINIPGLHPVDVPVEMRAEYNKGLEHLHRLCFEMDQKLPISVAVFKQEDIIKKVMGIICMVMEQRRLMSLTTSPTRYIISMEDLHSMTADLQRTMERFSQLATAMRQRLHMNPMHGQQQQPIMPHMNSVPPSNVNNTPHRTC